MAHFLTKIDIEGTMMCVNPVTNMTDIVYSGDAKLLAGGEHEIFRSIATETDTSEPDPLGPISSGYIIFGVR